MVWAEMSYNQYNQSALTISERLWYEYEPEEIFEYNEDEHIDEKNGEGRKLFNFYKIGEYRRK